MSDDLSNTGSQDRSRISLSEEYEVAYWTKKFEISHDELADAVAQVGSSADAVAIYLGKAL